jgi:hypothetical protein
MPRPDSTRTLIGREPVESSCGRSVRAASAEFKAVGSPLLSVGSNTVIPATVEVDHRDDCRGRIVTAATVVNEPGLRVEPLQLRVRQPELDGYQDA